MNKAQKAIEALKELKAYDISPQFFSHMPAFWAHPNCWIEQVRTRERNGYNCNLVMIGEHMGAHIDAPIHTCDDPNAWDISKFPVDYFIAPYKKYALDRFNPEAGVEFGMDVIKKCEEEDGFSVEEGDIILLQYGWDKYYFMEERGEIKDYIGSNTPGINEEVRKYFADKKIKAIGADSNTCELGCKDNKFVSIERSGHEVYFHPNNIPIMENFVNMQPAPAEGLFIALPWAIRGGSGSPVRVVLYG